MSGPTGIRGACAAALLALASCRAGLAADREGAAAGGTIAGDYAAIVEGAAGQMADGYGTLGSVPVFGRASFPVLVDKAGVPAVAAGRLGDGARPTAARMVAAAHTGFFDTRGTGATSRLFLNSVLWASRRAKPDQVTVGLVNDKLVAFLQAAGFRLKPVAIPNAKGKVDLSGCDVFVCNFHEPLSDDALARIRAFAQAGGGLVVCSTPWALKEADLARAQEVLEPFGLAFGGAHAGGDSFPVAADPPAPIRSAAHALDAIRSGAAQRERLTLEEQRVACAAIDRVLAARPGLSPLADGLDALHDDLGWIAPTRAKPLTVEKQPVEALLVRYQSGLLDSLDTAGLFVHPAAADVPGLPPAGAERVTRTVAIDGDAPVSKLMQSPDRPTRVETGLYAGPGEAITVTLPRDKAGKGLMLHVGGTEDTIFNRPRWDSYPKLWRRVPLERPKTETGHALGGLITILVPPGANLGTFDVTFANVLPAPCFTLGVDAEDDWPKVRSRPAPWGFVRTPKLVIYVSRAQLAATADIGAVARHWDAVMNLADDHYGYGPFRRRAEVVTTNRQVSAGAAYAQYPIELGWGVDKETELASSVEDGNWGTYHELGHTFQADFNGAFVIPTHAEVDVNLLPGMVYALIHDRTAWDGDVHGTYNADKRLKDRADFLGQREEERTWKNACGRTAAYDFYFNLAEAFGWSAYKTALTRLMQSLQGGRDPELDALDSKDPNFKRNRFYVLMCTATGRNLDRYFQRYGLGVPGRGAEISPAVKEAVAARGYPVWTDNQPLAGLSQPDAVVLPLGVKAGRELATLEASDPEPGTIFTFEITAGNEDGSFAIDRRRGVVTLAGIAPGKSASRDVTVTCHDNGVPRHSLSRSFTVSVGRPGRKP
ncbi:MAG: hypothetical protein EBR28_10000 [Planctomycetia bacterium]|nr:hypothetical protein [Planctomycetia bacterium]